MGRLSGLPFVVKRSMAQVFQLTTTVLTVFIVVVLTVVAPLVTVFVNIVLESVGEMVAHHVTNRALYVLEFCVTAK